jgi:hypothetical protein
LFIASGARLAESAEKFWLDEMKKDGTSAAISQKWFGADIVK